MKEASNRSTSSKRKPVTQSKFSPGMRDWLNHTVYPHLTHAQIFGALPGYTDREGDFYADCPVCHRHGVFYGLLGRQVGTCKSCGRTIGWFGFIRHQFDGDEDRATEYLAELAGVTTGPDGEPLRNRSESIVSSFFGLFECPESADDPLP